jgi:catechol 2,3-dioxygenase-like lactoylglutathione lyase family enzyme
VLDKDTLVAFVPMTDAASAREFYEKRLGLTFLRDDGFALLFDANGTRLRIARVGASLAPHPFTALGWEVTDIAETVRRLAEEGIALERYAFRSPDPTGVCTFPNGDRVAWFKDPDGNILSLAQMVPGSGDGS